MNITMNSASLPVSGEAAVTTVAAGEGLPLDPALAAQAGAQAPLAFLQFMQADAALPLDPAQPALSGAAPEAALDAALPAADAQDEHLEAAEDSAAQPPLAAMSMPLMPSMMAMPAALSATMRMTGTQQVQERAADAAPSATAVGAAASADGNAGAVELPLADRAALDATSAQPAHAGATPQPARADAQQQPVQPAAIAAQAASAAASGEHTGADAQGGASGKAAQGAGTDAGFGVNAPATSPAPAATRDGGTLSLSGPPTAWRQSLQEALGDRLHLQLGKNAEQAVIRLDPPMLGRVEISIRHAAGSLEVNITATHSEVLRQLNTVSDNLRNDLAGRQYADVSVNVSQAPRAQAAAQPGAGFGAGFADQQGRGRQQGQDQDERAPGAALAEAHHSTTAFSLNGHA